MIIAVTGYRDYRDGQFIRQSLREVQMRFGVQIHWRVGDALGADEIVRMWLQANGKPYQRFIADWEGLGKAAGPERNERMLLGLGDPFHPQPADLLLGFPRTDGVKIKVPGSGTWGCLIRASELGIRVEIPPYKPSGEQ